MGSETAANLYSSADANAQYMFDAMQLENSAALSEAEKISLSSELNDLLQEQTLEVPDLAGRLAAFRQERARIVGASLPPEEERSQVEELLQQRFKPDELVRLQHLDLAGLPPAS